MPPHTPLVVLFVASLTREQRAILAVRWGGRGVMDSRLWNLIVQLGVMTEHSMDIGLALITPSLAPESMWPPHEMTQARKVADSMSWDILCFHTPNVRRWKQKYMWGIYGENACRTAGLLEPVVCLFILHHYTMPNSPHSHQCILNPHFLSLIDYFLDLPKIEHPCALWFQQTRTNLAIYVPQDHDSQGQWCDRIHGAWSWDGGGQ